MAWLTDVVLRRRAGATIYQRGGYLVGAVADLVEQPDAVTATVASSGSRAVRYRVSLQQRGGDLAGECDCPQGLEGHFCKHCVAVGRRVVNGAPPDRSAAAPPRPATDPGPDEQRLAVHAYLAGCTREELAELLRGAARDDPALLHRLWVLVSASEPGQLRTRTERLGEGYAATGGAAFAERARAVVFALGHLPTARAGLAHELLPSVLRHLLNALDHDASDDDYAADDLDEHAVDDETPVIDAVDAAWRTYVALCATVPPDPVAFAAWFAELRLAHPAYRLRLPAADLAGLPGVLAACRSRLDGHHGDADAVWSLTDEVLQAIGDTDAYVAFLAGDLSTYKRYARVAEVLVAAGRTDEAVSWLERARQPEVPLRDPATPVVELLARLYTDHDRLAEALEVRRRHFTATRTEAAYRALKQAADRASVDWTPLRAGVLDLLGRDARFRDADTVVRILLAEGEPDEAWATARRYGCESHTLVMAAKARAVNHPADAIDVYWDQIDEALVFHDRDRNRAYERVVNHLLILRDLVTRAGGDFGVELARFKATHRRKRNLMDELARRGLR